MIGLVLDNDPDCEHYRCGCMVQRWPLKRGKRRVRACICSPEHAEALYVAIGSDDVDIEVQSSTMIYDDATPEFALPIDADAARRWGNGWNL